MQLDYNTQYADGQSAITLASGGETATTILDHMVADWNGGAGTPVWVIFSIGTTFSGAVSNPIYVEWQSATASGGTYVTHIRSRLFSIGEMTKGTFLMAHPIPGGQTIRRFTKFAVTLSGVSLTAGVFDAYLSFHAPKY